MCVVAIYIRGKLNMMPRPQGMSEIKKIIAKIICMINSSKVYPVEIFMLFLREPVGLSPSMMK